MAKSLFNILFILFYFILFSYEIKVTYMEVQDFSIRLGLDICISIVRNPTGTLSSSPCQMLIKEQLA